MARGKVTSEGVRSWLPVALLAVIAAVLIAGLFRQRADDTRQEEMQAEADRLAAEVRKVVEETARIQKEIERSQVRAETSVAQTRRILERCGVRVEGAGATAKVVVPAGRETAVRECIEREAAACQAGKCR